MNRRRLLRQAARLIGSGAIVRASQPVLRLSATTIDRHANTPDEASSSIGSARQYPSKPVVLRNGSVTAIFDAQDAMPFSYRFRGQVLAGETEGKAAHAIVCRMDPREYRTATALVTGMQRTPAKIMFTLSVAFESTLAATFEIAYELNGAQLIVTLGGIHEEPGFELIEVGATRLIAALEKEGGDPWMAEGRHGGSFVRLSEAKAYRFPDNEYFGRISTELPVGVVGRAGIGCVMEVTAFMDGTETEITGLPGAHHATLGCVMTHRVHGGRCYSMNDGATPICGNSGTPNLLIGQPSKTTFDFFVCEGKAQPWLVAAKLLRARAPESPTQYFSDKFLYIVAGKKKVDAQPGTTFSQSEQMVRDIALLTDQAPQVALISGWAYDGQDTGFPSEDKVNSSLGTSAELLRLIQVGKNFNANVTLNVNYDDAYKSSPIFNNAFIARRPDGQIWKSRAWDGEDSYVVGMAKFMNGGWGSKRIAYTVDHYKIHDAILIDAMSWFAIRNDWDPQAPASGYKNLIDGKYRVVREFRAKGIAVTSEQLRYPFIGVIAESMDGPGTSDAPFGGEPIPFVSTVYRGSAIWGTGDGSIRPQRELFWNTRSALWFQADTKRSKMTDFYFLVVLPFSKMHRLKVEEYESTKTFRRISLENGSYVEIQRGSEAYTAVFKGVEIARDDATFCPVDNNRIAFYSRTPRQLRCPLPATWNPSEVTARILSVTGRSSHAVRIEGGFIVVDVEAQQPIMAYANALAVGSALPDIEDLAD